MSKTIKTTFSVMIATIFSKIFGFIREIVFASVLGVTVYTDAYYIALVIPAILFDGIARSFETVFIPLYLKIKEKNKKESIKYTNNLINTLMIISIFISILGLIFTKPLLKVFALGFDCNSVNIAARYTKIILPSIIIISICCIMIGFLRANNNFVVPELIGVPNNILIITCILIMTTQAKEIIAYATLFGTVLEFIFLVIFAYRQGYKYKFNINFKDENLKKTIFFAIPIFLGVAVKKINILIDRNIASTLIDGSISALNFAHKIDLFIFGVVSLSISRIMYREFSLIVAKNDKTKFYHSLKKSINVLIIILIPMTVLMMILSKPIIKLLFERGAFDSKATLMTSTALFYYSIGMLGFGLREILSRAFYSIEDTKTPMFNGCITVLINIILSLILIKYLQHGGIALATSISSIIGTILFFYKLSHKLGYLYHKTLLSIFIKVCISSTIMGATVKLCYKLITKVIPLGINLSTSLFISIFLGGLMYLLSIKLFKVEEVSIVDNILKKKLINKQNKLYVSYLNVLRFISKGGDRLSNDIMKKYWIVFCEKWKIFLIIFLGVFITGVLSFYIIEPEFEATTTFIIGNPTIENEQDYYSDILPNDKLTATYVEVIKSRAVLTKVINNLKLDTNYEKLTKKVNITLVDKTGIIKIIVKYNEAQVSANIANEIATVFSNKIANMINIQNIQILDRAIVPREQESPKLFFNIFIAGILGILIAIFIIILIEYIDNTVRTEYDIRENTKLNIIGRVFMELKDIDYEIQINETYRDLRTYVQYVSNTKSFVITSTESKEGKSTIVTNLGNSIAQTDKKVLLIDCNLRNPCLHKYYDLPNDIGLTDLFMGEIDLLNIINITDNENLSVMFSGSEIENPSEILGTKKFESILDSLKDFYDVIIIDSPAINTVTDAALIATLVDGVILVCEVKKCKIENLKKIINKLKTLKCNILGVILNKVTN